jgi:hypothetical protein
VNGKTVSETFASPAELRKARKICRARPVGNRLVRRKGTAEIVQREAALEIAALPDIVFAGLHKSGHFDLEAVEMATRAAAHELGAKALRRLRAPTEFVREVSCPCGHRGQFPRDIEPDTDVWVWTTYPVGRTAFRSLVSRRHKAPSWLIEIQDAYRGIRPRIRLRPI